MLSKDTKRASTAAHSGPILRFLLKGSRRDPSRTKGKIKSDKAEVVSMVYAPRRLGEDSCACDFASPSLFPELRTVKSTTPEKAIDKAERKLRKLMEKAGCDKIERGY